MDSFELIWKPIVGYEGLYIVSNYGDVISLPRKKWSGRNKSFSTTKEKKLSLCNRSGYKAVELFKDGKGTMKSVHRLVAESFIPNIDNKKEVNHKDGIRTNNLISNLEWATRKENSIHSVNTLRKNVGNAHNNRKINSDSAYKIKEFYNTRKSLGLSCDKIGFMFGITGANVCQIGKNKTWK